jgi:hypothetical protein
MTNPQYCIKCERLATKKDSLGLPRCDYHINPDIDESEVPPFKGVIPEGAVCFQTGCDATPKKILDGSCFCEHHYADAKSGNRYRRNLGL